MDDVNGNARWTLCMKRFDVYAIGNALVDYLTFTDDKFLIQNNIKKGIMTLVESPPQQMLQKFERSQLRRCSGGSAANTIIGVAVLGGKGCFTGKVGRDEDGEFYRQNLLDSGVPLFSIPDHHPTGSCVSLITEDAERSMLTFLGAASHLQLSDISEEAVAQSSYIYIEGYLWDSPSAQEAARTAMAIARHYGAKIAFSFSDPWLVERFRDDFENLIDGNIDLIFCNDREAEQLTGFHDPEKAAELIHRRVPKVCLTIGDQGAVIAADGRVSRTPALTSVEAVDTTGAGDLYAAGVLRGLTLGFDLTASSLIGARAAAAIVSKIGARLEPEDLH